MAKNRQAATGNVRSFREAAEPIGQAAPQPPTGEALSEGWLTQYGNTNTTPTFREEPRWEQHTRPEFDVSAFPGKLTLTETIYLMYGVQPRPQHRHRHFDVAKLVDARYRCLDTPRPNRPQHASILASCAETTVQAHKDWWADSARTTLESLAESGV